MPTNFAAGLDDTATMTQQCDGWSCIVMEETVAIRFESEAKILLPPQIKEFHGKKFKPAYESEYRSFLELIRRSLERDPLSRAASSLNSTGWKGDFLPFCEVVVRKKCAELGIADEQFITVTTKLFPPLVTFQRLLCDAASDSIVRVSIDADDTLELFPTLKAIVNGQAVAAESMLIDTYNEYRSARFPTAPANSGISICRGSKSFLIQAADVIGNFSLAHVYDQAGQATPRVAQKAKIYRDVFGDTIDDTVLKKGCHFIGGELRLKQEGALTLMIK